MYIIHITQISVLIKLCKLHKNMFVRQEDGIPDFNKYFFLWLSLISVQIDYTLNYLKKKKNLLIIK